MKRNGILCVLIAAALLVTSLAAVSADQTAWITQQAMQDNDNAISGTMPNIAINSSNNQVIDSFNVQEQVATTIQTGGIVSAGGDIRDTDITKCCSCGVGNQTALIGQVAIQTNNNTIDASPADVGDITIDAMREWDAESGDMSEEGSEEIHIVVPIPNVAVDSPNNQAIISTNIQQQVATTIQSGELVVAEGDIRDSNVYNGPIVADGDGNGNGNGDGPAPKPPVGPGPASRGP